MLKHFKPKHFHLEIIIILILGLTPLLWYRDGFIALGHDMGFPLDPISHFKDRLFTWTDRLGPFGSSPTQVLAGIFIHGLEALLSLLGLSLVKVQKLTFIFWFTLPGITMYILLRSIHPKKEDYPIRIAGSLFYMINHYLLQGWLIAERTKFSIVAALPIVILLIINVIQRKQSLLKNSIILSVTIFFLNGGEGIPLLGGLAVASLSTFLTLIFLSKENFLLKLKRGIYFITLSCLLLLILNVYWIYPYLRYSSQAFTQVVEAGWGTAGAIAWSQGISANSSWINLFKLQGIPEWYNNFEHPYANEFFNNPILIILTLVFPTIAIYGLLQIKNLRRDLFNIRICFIVMLLAAIPFSAGSHQPLGGLYDFALSNIPGFVIFRSGFFKFSMVIWLAYSYLIAVGLKEIICLLREKSKDKLKRYIPGLFLGIYIVSLLVYNYPYFTGIFFNWSKEHSTMVKIPRHIFEAKEELDKNKFSTRTLYFPNADLRTKYIEYDWGYFSLEALQDVFGRKSSVINGVLADIRATDLINAIYKQYVLFGHSSLAGFIGADRAVWQADFISPNYIDNPLTDINKAFKTSSDFRFNKAMGKWDFFDFVEDVLPIIYSPGNIGFVSASSTSLPLITNLPDDKGDYDAYLWTNSDNPGDFIGSFSRYVIEAGCADCPNIEAYPIYPSPSKILIPGSKLYELNKLFEKIRLIIIRDPNSRIDLILSESARVMGNLGLLIYDKDKENFGNAAVRDLSENVDIIKSNIEEIKDEKLKIDVLKKVNYFLNFFMLNTSQWKNTTPSESLTSNLKILDNKFQSYILKIKQELPKKSEVKVDPLLYKYNLEITKEGSYDIYLYLQGYKENFVKVLIDGQYLSLQKVNKDWYGVSNLPLVKSSLDISVSKSDLTKPVVATVNNFKLYSNKGSSCKNFNLNGLLSGESKLNPEINYKISYQHNQDVGKFSPELIETNTRLNIEDKVEAVYPETLLIDKDNNIYSTTINYIPSHSAEDLKMSFCLTADTKPLEVEISDFVITAQPNRPIIFASINEGTKIFSTDIEYVALNQTKYLIKIKNPKENFILNFNSRFDKGWKLREVDYQKAEKFFKGEKKSYLGGKVIEYEKGNSHIITDIIFPDKSEKKSSPQFKLNGFSNGFLIGQQEGGEQIYLLEYNYQNDFYKAVGISLVSLILVLFFYIFKYVKKKA